MKRKKPALYLKRAFGNVGFNGKVLTLPQWAAYMLPRLVRDFSGKLRKIGVENRCRK